LRHPQARPYRAPDGAVLLAPISGHRDSCPGDRRGREGRPCGARSGAHLARLARATDRRAADVAVDLNARCAPRFLLEEEGADTRHCAAQNAGKSLHGARRRRPRRRARGPLRFPWWRLVAGFPADLTDVGHRVSPSPCPPFVLSQAATQLVRHARPSSRRDDPTTTVMACLRVGGLRGPGQRMLARMRWSRRTTSSATAGGRWSS
jgi:hypothetical protein